jgi:glycosyltransferase involved in cell wall biosynthesis
MTAPVRLLELRSVWGTGGGPDKTILLGSRQTNGSRISTTVCYIRDRRDEVFSIDRQAASLGVDYVEVLERHSFDPSIWPALRAVVRDRGIQIVHAHDYKTDLLAWGLGAFENVIPLSTAHGWAGQSPRERFYYAVEKRLLTRFPRVIAVSSPIKAELVRTGSRPERVTVIPNGIDHRRFARDRSRTASVKRDLGYEPQDVVIGAVGRLESEKCYDLLIEAFARIRERRPRLRLAIAGEGSCRLPLEQAIGRLKVSATSRLLGHYADVAALHHAFDLFVQSSDREGSPNAVLEAMALETPLVATDVGGTDELVTDGVHGLIVPKNDVAALAHAMEVAIDDPEAANARARTARQRVELELSFEKRMHKVDAICHELITDRARS